MREHPVEHLRLLCALLTVATLIPGRCLGATAGYLSPISIVAGGEGRVLYVAEADAERIAVFDIASGQIAETISVAVNPVGLAVSTGSGTLYVTSAIPAGTVQVVDIRSGRAVESIAVGHTPVAVAAHPDARVLYVCNQFSNSIGVVDLVSKRQITAIGVPREPVAMALTSDGKYLFVANHLPAGPANADYVAAVVSVIDTVAKKVVKNIELPNGSTNLRGITISPDGEYAYLTHILSRYQFPTAYFEQNWVNTNAMTVIDVPRAEYVNTVLLDDVGYGAGNPYGVACTGDGKSILVTHAGTHELSVIDREGLHLRLPPARSARNFESEIHSTAAKKRCDPAYSPGDVPNDLTFLSGIRRRFKLAGNGPRGLAVLGTKVYAAEYFSDTIGVVDIDQDPKSGAKSMPLGEKKTLTKVRRGQMLFHDATLGRGRWHSCASCHTGDARSSALNWDLLNDDIGNPKNVKSLLLAHSTPPAMVTGARKNAEVAVRSGIRYIQFSYPIEYYAGAIDEYLKSLEPVRSPYLLAGELSPAAKRGEKLFGEAGCASCHSAPLHTNMRKCDVGTGTDREYDTGFDTPTLVEVWRTVPYLHDGRAVTIKEVLTKFNKNDRHGKTSNLTEKEINELAEYVLTL